MLKIFSQLLKQNLFYLRFALSVILIPLFFLLFSNREIFSDNNITSFLSALLVIIIAFSFSGSWDFLTDEKRIKFSSNFSIPVYLISYMLISGLFAYCVFVNYSNYMFDDSAFTLRYLDNFSKGYFFHYNTSDTPVYGISCFTFGLFTGMCCWLHLLTPEESIYFAGFLGLFFISFLGLKILRILVRENSLILLFWFALVFSSKMFLNVAKSGMESSFHISFVFATILFFLQNKRKLTWLFLSICVISKLDTVPLVVIIGLIEFFRNKRDWMPFHWSNSFWKEFFLFALLPMFIWIGFTFFLFGSPLPQSAYSKIFLHYHPNDYWFPFLKYYIFGGRIELVALVSAVLFMLHFVVFLFHNKSISIKPLVFGFSFIGIMVLFYFYNPGEQMSWYYVLPDLLLVFQLISSFYFFTSYISVSKLKILLTGILLYIYIQYIGIDVLGGKYWMETYLECVERERLEVGKYVGNQVGEKDSIMSNHGLPVRHVKGYVIDMSGLNSKYAAEFKIDPLLLFQKVRPQWAISHNSINYAALMASHGYLPVRLFYDITEYTYPEWCLYKRLPGDSSPMLFKPIDSLKMNHRPTYNGGIVYYSKDTLVLGFDSCESIQKIFLGIKRQYLPFNLRIDFVQSNRVVASDTIPVSHIDEYPLDSKFSKAIEIECTKVKPFDKIVLFALEQGKSISIIEPYIYRKK